MVFRLLRVIQTVLDLLNFLIVIKRHISLFNESVYLRPQDIQLCRFALHYFYILKMVHISTNDYKTSRNFSQGFIQCTCKFILTRLIFQQFSKLFYITVRLFFQFFSSHVSGGHMPETLKTMYSHNGISNRNFLKEYL